MKIQLRTPQWKYNTLTFLTAKFSGDASSALAQLDSGLPGWFSDRLVSFSDPKVVPPDGRMGAAAPPDALPHS